MMKGPWLWLSLLVVASACTASSPVVTPVSDTVIPEDRATPIAGDAETASERDALWHIFGQVVEDTDSEDEAGCRADGHATACALRRAHADEAETVTPAEERDSEDLVSDFVIELYQGEMTLGSSEPRFSEVLALGKPVVVVFWAGGCPVCRREMPEVQAASMQFEDDVVFLGVDVGNYTGLGAKEDALMLIEEQGVTFLVGSISEAVVLRDYRITGVPALLFFTPDGEQVDRFTGAMREDALVRAIEDLLQASR